MSIVAATLAHSRTAAYQVTSDLSCLGGIREERVVVVMTGIEDVEVQREDGEEEEKPTEGNGKLAIDCINTCFLLHSFPQEALMRINVCFFFFASCD